MIHSAKSWRAAWSKNVDDEICDTAPKEQFCYDKNWVSYDALNGEKHNVNIQSAKFSTYFVYCSRTNHKLMSFDVESWRATWNKIVGDEICDVVPKESS